MTERITKDIYMLTNLTTYMDITLEYEENKYQGNLSKPLKQARDMLEDLIVTLANMTGTDVQEILSRPSFYSGGDSSSAEDTTSGVSGVTTTETGEVCGDMKQTGQSSTSIHRLML